MEILLTLFVICAVASVLIWLARQISFGPPILKDILVAFIVLVAILKIWPML